MKQGLTLHPSTQLTPDLTTQLTHRHTDTELKPSHEPLICYNNVKKTKILLAILLLRSLGINATSLIISDLTNDTNQQTKPLLNRYFKFHYISRTKCKDKDCMYNYKLLLKGKRTLKSLVKRFIQHRDLDLMDLHPQVVLFDKKDSSWLNFHIDKFRALIVKLPDRKKKSTKRVV